MLRISDILLLFVVVLLFVLCESLNKGDVGVCEVEIAVKKTREKVFKTRKWCGKHKCPKKTGIETYIEKKPTPTCCEGWEYVLKDDSCKAQCQFGCNRGRCVAPNDCRCDPPLILKNNNSCVEPICEPLCINAQCVAPNTCSCNTNFTIFNTTHCAPACLPGYFNDPITLECTPKCDSPCTNGTCTAPNTCTCFDGYRLKDDDRSTCVPDCKPSCVNGDCVAPDVCSCWEGYNFNSSWQCKPVCDLCEHGDCVSPNVCKCHEGYSKKDGIVCTPDCDRNCSNGYCSEPNTCTCNSGYEIDPEDKFVCRPVCSPNCVNASCVAPNTCSCHPGYETTGNNSTCRPKCDVCENGECVAPNQCQCNRGYSKKGDRCAPECEPGCVNASCVSPNECSCLIGYEVTGESHVCKPKCTSCDHGECVAPSICKCHSGYNMSNEVCSPVCSKQCVNGHCSTPNECTCKNGYIRNETRPFVCYRPCRGLCDYGTCTLHGECICDAGYELLNDTCVAMEPVECISCEGNCTEGICWCADGRPCYFATSEVDSAEVASTTRLAGLELTWVVGGAIGLLLLTLLIIVIERIWRRRKDYETKTADDGHPFGSVVYTVPDTLMQRSNIDKDTFDEEVFDEEDTIDENTRQTSERLLKPEEETYDNV